MIPPRSDKLPWIRKLDGDMHIVDDDEQPQIRWYPGSLTELLWVVKEKLAKPSPSAGEAKTCGSHWAISKAAVAPGQMIETATPVHESRSDQAAPRLNHVLHEVIPGCMTSTALDYFIEQDVHPFEPTAVPDQRKFYLFHVEAGMRLYELYDYMDSGKDGETRGSLAWRVEEAGTRTSYLGPWALETMGGAGGQTIAGAASTATHGGDVASSAIGDAIVAIHLIAPNGQEYWIERLTILPGQQFDLVDDVKLEQLYATDDTSKPGGEFRTEKIKRLKSDDLMNAAIVSCGRMGIIYSVVVRAVRQFALREEISTSPWNDVRTWIADPAHPMNQAAWDKHFFRVDIDVYPKPKFDWHTAAVIFGTGILGGLPLAVVGLYAGLQGDEYRAWVMTRELHPLESAKIFLPKVEYYGREQRGGRNSGAMPPIGSEDVGSFRHPCRSANWLRQFLQDLQNQLEGIRDEAVKEWVIAGVIIAESTITAPPLAALAAAYQDVCLRIILFCQAWILTLGAIRGTLPDNIAFSDFVSGLVNTFSGMHAHSIVQLLHWIATNGDADHSHMGKPLTAISYAVMDRHDYQNKGCIAPGDSIEFFMDATDAPALTSFIDYALDEVRSLADDGQGFGGYISLRFMKNSPSFLAMQRWPRTCSIEIAGLSRVDGCDVYMERLEEESRKRNIILHWGQRNDRKQEDLEQVFSPAVGGPLDRWREALSRLSEHGRLHQLSTQYTSSKGLEITRPRLYRLTASLTDGCENETTLISYDAFKNPPETQVSLRQRFRDGRVIDLPVDPTKYGEVQIELGAGRSTVELRAVRWLNDRSYPADPLEAELHGFRTGDSLDFKFQAEKRQVDAVERWYIEMNYTGIDTVSRNLRVSAASLVTSDGGDWVMRNADIGADLISTTIADRLQLPSLPPFRGDWRFFSKAPRSTASALPPPTVTIQFTIAC
ncbi:hypothetical protein AB0425_25790 [Actinosynnema sp. NPDC051121]